MDFLDSGIAQYLLQAVLHSAIIAVAVETVMRAWHIEKPSLQIEFRFLGLLLPALYLPLLYLYPPRTESHFRQQVALFDFNQWLGLKLWGELALWHIFFAVLALTALFFLIKEAAPVIYHYVNQRSFPAIKQGQFPKLDRALDSLSLHRNLPKPQVFVSSGKTPVVHTLRHRMLVLSESTIDLLDADELEAVIAHELAHFNQWDIIISRGGLLLRSLMFYNPVALLVFRRILHDNEKLCDDIAVSVVGKRAPFASGLLKVFRSTATDLSPTAKSSLSMHLSPVRAMEDRACLELVRERVAGVLKEDEEDSPYPNLRLLATALMLMTLLFFVV